MRLVLRPILLKGQGDLDEREDHVRFPRTHLVTEDADARLHVLAFGYGNVVVLELDTSLNQRFLMVFQHDALTNRVFPHF